VEVGCLDDYLENSLTRRGRFDEETTKYCTQVSEATESLKVWTSDIRKAAEVAQASCRSK
jgi:hypothetical protein